jgi:hypothetical protein
MDSEELRRVAARRVHEGHLTAALEMVMTIVGEP